MSLSPPSGDRLEHCTAVVGRADPLLALVPCETLAAPRSSVDPPDLDLADRTEPDPIAFVLELAGPGSCKLGGVSRSW